MLTKICFAKFLFKWIHWSQNKIQLYVEYLKCITSIQLFGGVSQKCMLSPNKFDKVFKIVIHRKSIPDSIENLSETWNKYEITVGMYEVLTYFNSIEVLKFKTFRFEYIPFSIEKNQCVKYKLTANRLFQVVLRDGFSFCSRAAFIVERM